LFILHPSSFILERWREGAITLACRVLSFGFDLPRRLQGRPAPRLEDLPAGARVVFIKPCCLGDVVLTTASVAALAEARPDLKLDFVVSEWSRPVLAGNPWLQRLVPTGVNGSQISGRQLLALAWRLRREQYAAALVLDRSPRLTLLPWLAGIPVRAGIDNLGRGFALNVRARQDGKLQHEAEVYLDVVRELGVAPADPHLEYCPPAETEASFAIKAAELGLDEAHPLAVIHPGGGQNPDTRVFAKRWPAGRFGIIAARLVARGFKVVIIGDANDHPAVDQLIKVARQDLQGSGRDDTLLIDGCERFTIAEIGALLKRTALFVGNDTGLMHLAAACGAAVVAIFGPSSPVAYSPYTKKGRAVAPPVAGVKPGLPLREYQALSVEAGGIEAVTVEMVWAAIDV
jgi:lipopolysaccharide heptosyltransferase II